MKATNLSRLFFAGLLITAASCKNYESNSADSQAQIFNTNYDLSEARTDSQAEYEAFKMKINEKLTENDAILSELKLKAANKSKEQKLEIAKKIAKLEVRNNNLKTKLINYTKYDAATWESFKKEVETSSVSLEKDIAALTIE